MLRVEEKGIYTIISPKVLFVFCGIFVALPVYAENLNSMQPPLVPSVAGMGANGAANSNFSGQNNSGSDFFIPNSQDGLGSYSSPSLNGTTPIRGRSMSGQDDYQNDDFNSQEIEGLKGSTRNNGSSNNIQSNQHGKFKPARRMSEFERFVRTSTGRTLLPFGTELFNQDNPNYTPIKDVPVPDDYTIGAGDELVIRAWGILDADYKAMVNRDGTIYIPKIGVVTVGGIRASELNNHIKNAIGRVFKNVQLNVSLGKLRAIRVYVVGNAQSPGAYTVSSLSTLVNLIFASGGPSESGSMRHIQVRRGQKVIADLDLYQFIRAGDRSRDVTLQNNDVIIYAPVGARVALVSNVERPGIYELMGKTASVSEILPYAGGMSVLMSQQKVVLERIEANTQSTRRVDDFPLDQKGLAHSLQDGDMLTFLPVSPRIENAITLRGNVAWPLRYPYKTNMKISDLIPNVEALVTKDYYQRKNILVQYEQPHLSNRQMNSQSEQMDMRANRGEDDTNKFRDDDNRATQQGQFGQSNRNVIRTPSEIKNLVDEINWSYAVIERLNADRISPQLITFDLGKAVRDHDPNNDLPLLPGDVVTVFSTKDIRVPVDKQTRFIRIEGEVGAPGIYQVQPGEKLRKVLSRAGGLSSQAYLFGTEFYREATRKQQRESLKQAIQQTERQMNTQVSRMMVNANARQDTTPTNYKDVQDVMGQRLLSQLRALNPLGRIALELTPEDTALNQLPDIELEDGDKVVIPSRPSFVYVAGAVNNSNALIWKDRYTVQDYIKRAGPSIDSDLDKIFVARADGTVITESNGGGWFSSSINNFVLAPGDTVVVPENLRESGYSIFIRGMRDWSQILGQFGVSAAAIKVLRGN